MTYRAPILNESIDHVALLRLLQRGIRGDLKLIVANQLLLLVLGLYAIGRVLDWIPVSPWVTIVLLIGAQAIAFINIVRNDRMNTRGEQMARHIMRERMSHEDR